MKALPRVLITAGPTHEPIDAVRYLSNRSSGRMGIALADATSRRGWPTTLLLGPVALKPPDHSQLTTLRFQTTSDLQALLESQWPKHDVLFMAAAVADYRPAAPPSGVSHERDGKLRRQAKSLILELEPTPDLLASLGGSKRPNQTLIGFALEPAAELLDSAQEKLRRKKLDAIVANPLQTMDSPVVEATVLFKNGTRISTEKPLAKLDFATWLLNELDSLLGGRHENDASTAK